MQDHAPAHAEYDDITEEYAASKQLPFRTVVEAPTLFGLAGDLRGLAVPDGTSFGFDNFWLAPETYEAAFAKAGLAGFRFVDCHADPAALRKEPALWQDFLRDYSLTGLVASRPL
jgi:hypothetical protein